MKRTAILFLSLAIIGIAAFPQEQQRPKVGLVLSGGGAKGFAYIGMLKVIEEAGLPIDYIGGSSIGAIVGGLYATGYHPDTIESLIRAQDWEFVLSEDLERKYIAYEDKLFGDKYVLKIPIDNYKVTLKPSIFESPNIDLMLAELFSPAQNITDFSQLPIPFICIGTDLLTGDPVVLDNGHLPKAIRSSMAIPGYWSPIMYQGKYLADGGVVNNYPAPQVKAMGADIIVGGDVQSGMITDIKELNTLTNILDQIIGFLRTDANIEGRSMTDVYIKFPMDFSTMDFTEYDSIIAIGEHIARQHFDEIKALADSLNEIEYKPMIARNAYPTDTFNIGKVKIEGMDKMRRDFATGYFKEFNNSTVSFSDIESSIKSAYGTQFYETIFPRFSASNGKTDLILNLAPSKQGHLSAGVHYDSDYAGSLLVNITMRNLLIQQSKLFADLILGQNPRFNALYILNNGIKPGLGISLDIYNFEYAQYEKTLRVNDWNIDNIKTSVFMPLTLKNDAMFKIGGSFEYCRSRPKVEVDTSYGFFSGYAGSGIAFASLDLDTRDKTTFPTHGALVQIKGKYIIPLNESLSNIFNNSFMVYMKYDRSFSLFHKMVAQPGLFLGYTFENEEPPTQHNFGLGGLNPVNYIENHVPFTGLKFIQSTGLYAGVARLKLQYQPMNKVYVTAMSDFGINERYWEDLVPENSMLGYGLKFSYDSFIGPIEFSVMGSNRTKGSSFFFNVGHWF